MLSAGSQEIVLGTLSIADLPRLFEPPPYEMPFNVTFGGQITLLGATLDEDAEAIRLTLVWRAEREMAQDVKLFVHLLDAADIILTQVDQMPLDNTYPSEACGWKVRLSSMRSLCRRYQAEQPFDWGGTTRRAGIV
ncbi:MAG: hypothetical protein V9E89_03595 [Ilumatobacteraceae bacterium]